ncbi:VanZ family protein [Bacillus infantis]|uniref:VanZ family protein n=1 Tax=Bacillus infantis TaxID=324767 RepID=UPI003CF51FF1
MLPYFKNALNDMIHFRPPYVMAIFGPPFLIMAMMLVWKNKQDPVLKIIWKMALLFFSFIYLMGVSLVTRVADIPFSVYERVTENRAVFSFAEEEVQLIPFRSIFHILSYYGMGVNIVGNILLLLPLGFLLPVWFGKLQGVYRTGFAVMLFSAGIEFLQIIFGVGVGSVDDVILNTLGGLIGYGLFRLAANVRNQRHLRNKKGTARGIY